MKDLFAETKNIAYNTIQSYCEPIKKRPKLTIFSTLFLAGIASYSHTQNCDCEKLMQDSLGANYEHISYLKAEDAVLKRLISNPHDLLAQREFQLLQKPKKDASRKEDSLLIQSILCGCHNSP